ncbi:glycosyltransferase, partial [bacterium]|nr:glycosyltransferase [bacterium]
RIAKFYRRDSVVIHPPVEIGNIKPSFGEGEYYICISRLVPYKKIDLAVRAFNKLGRQLVVVGTGPQLGYLKRIARENIRFEGFVSEERKIELLRNARALIFPGEEDFGITPVEAQAAGRPVIAYGKGGATETVIDGLTGVFFYEETEKALIDAVVKFEQMSFDPQLAVNNARHFGVQNFVSRMRQFITDSVAEFFGEEYVPKLISAMNPGVVNQV